MTDAYIYDAVRTPRGKGRKDGSLHEVTPVRLAVTALQALRDRNKLDTQAGRRRRAGLRHAGRRAGRGHRPHRGGAGGLRRDRARRAGQPLLRLGPRGHQHGGGAGHVGPEPGHDRRRRREHEPRADGLRRRRLAGRSGGRDPDVLRAAGHLGRRDRHQVRHEPRRRRRLRRRVAEARQGRLGCQVLQEVDRAGARPERRRAAEPRRVHAADRPPCRRWPRSSPASRCRAR